MLLSKALEKLSEINKQDKVQEEAKNEEVPGYMNRKKPYLPDWVKAKNKIPRKVQPWRCVTANNLNKSPPNQRPKVLPREKSPDSVVLADSRAKFQTQAVLSTILKN